MTQEKAYGFIAVFHWDEKKVAAVEEGEEFFTKELEKQNLEQAMVFARFFNLQRGVDDHAFVMKKTLNGGWVLMDSALPEPQYSKPVSSFEFQLDQQEFFKLVDEIWVYKLGEVELPNHGEWYQTWYRIITEDQTDYTYADELLQMARDSKSKSSTKRKSSLGKIQKRQ